jgi:hypothetical protein
MRGAELSAAAGADPGAGIAATAGAGPAQASPSIQAPRPGPTRAPAAFAPPGSRTCPNADPHRLRRAIEIRLDQPLLLRAPKRHQHQVRVSAGNDATLSGLLVPRQRAEWRRQYLGNFHMAPDRSESRPAAAATSGVPPYNTTGAAGQPRRGHSRGPPAVRRTRAAPARRASQATGAPSAATSVECSGPISAPDPSPRGREIQVRCGHPRALPSSMK